MEPLHLQFEANEYEEEQILSNRTDQKDPRIEEYLRQQFETSCDVTGQPDDTTPIRSRKEKPLTRKKVGCIKLALLY